MSPATQTDPRKVGAVLFPADTSFVKPRPRRPGRCYGEAANECRLCDVPRPERPAGIVSCSAAIVQGARRLVCSLSAVRTRITISANQDDLIDLKDTYGKNTYEGLGKDDEDDIWGGEKCSG